jgi:ADP-heptose:LPS heptosyltransferase
MTPERILMIKSHSLGVGDVLRSSAAWRALHDRYPGVALHLLFLSKHAGYPTEGLMHDHHLLRSAHFVTIREGDPSQAQAKRTPWRQLKAEVQRVSTEVQPDLVIDFEASGLRTTLVTRWAAQTSGAQRLGIAEFPGRGWCYDLAAPSVAGYRAAHGLPLRMDYTERDFVALAALGIQREGRAIELEVTPDGARYQAQLRSRLPSGLRVVGLNIGCGTPDAMPRRPPLEETVEAMHRILSLAPSVLVLTGAPFEKTVNAAFVQTYRQRYGDSVPIVDAAGETSLSGLTGLIALCDLFVSSDSGPYHMAVAMRCPTITWFMREEKEAHHGVKWCRCLLRPQPDQVSAAALALLSA